MKDIPRISGFQVRGCNAPLSTPHNTSGGKVSSFPCVLLDIKTDIGITGSAYVFVYTPIAIRPIGELVINLESLVVGQQCAPQHIEHLLSQRFRLLGGQGFTGIACALIDMCIWDIQCKWVGLPLYALLGGESKPVKAYAAIGMSGVVGSAEEARNNQKLGYKAMKAKIGYASLAEEHEVIKAIQSEIDKDSKLMVDYNQRLSVAEAKQRIASLAQFELAWVEEPTIAEDYSGHAEITTHSQTPIQAGENWWGTLELRKAIDQKSTDYIMPDVMKIGGVSGWLRASALATTHGIPLSSHLFPEISVHLLAASPMADWLEFVDWSNPLLAEPLQVKDSIAIPSNVPGIGIQWNEAAISAYPA